MLAITEQDLYNEMVTIAVQLKSMPEGDLVGRAEAIGALRALNWICGSRKAPSTTQMEASEDGDPADA